MMTVFLWIKYFSLCHIKTVIAIFSCPDLYSNCCLIFIMFSKTKQMKSASNISFLITLNSFEPKPGYLYWLLNCPN